MNPRVFIPHPDEEAPESAESVAQRNASQRCHSFHPATCGGDRMDEAHRKYQALHPDEDYGQLVAVPGGWQCPACSYSQPLHIKPILPPLLIPEVHLRYVRLARCRGWLAWFCCGWRFANRYGVTEWGFRVCGVTLSNWNDQRESVSPSQI